MKNIISAKSASANVSKELQPYNRVHSIFQNGINIKTKDGLVFIGNDKNGALPFGIHLRQRDIRKIIDINRKSIFEYRKEKNRLISGDLVIDLNNAYSYESKMSEKRVTIRNTTLSFLLHKIENMNFETGLDMTLSEILAEDNLLIDGLKNAIVSQDNRYIKNNLLKIIGRGKGLTPSGDDLLIGLIWANDIRRIFSEESISALKELIVEEGLTTDVSTSYYKAALTGRYSSRLIDLCNALINIDRLEIEKQILQIIEYGHTSGRDILSGIALGINMIIKD